MRVPLVARVEDEIGERFDQRAVDQRAVGNSARPVSRRWFIALIDDAEKLWPYSSRPLKPRPPPTFRVTKPTFRTSPKFAYIALDTRREHKNSRGGQALRAVDRLACDARFSVARDGLKDRSSTHTPHKSRGCRKMQGG
jgi:hypothetical protein